MENAPVVASGVGQQASITLLTAIPGSGKTLRVVGWIKKAIEAGELVYVCNLNGLKLPHIKFEDPREWRDLPAGSLLVVDEAQDFFRARRGGDPPEYITAMEKIRHWGVRLVLITQQPNYLDAHLRGLVGLHEHLVRENGKEASKIYRHHEVIEDVRSERGRSRYDHETWAFPKEDYALYESAQVHTVKYKMSARMKRGLMWAGAALVLFGVFGWKVYSDKIAPVLDKDASSEDGRPAAVALDASQPGGKPAAPVTVQAFAEQLQPRIEGLAWSAPIFDGRQARAEPELYCMASEAGEDALGQWKPAGVTCFTEQGTRYVVNEKLARSYARNGTPYNPFKEPTREAASAARAAAEPAVIPQGVSAQGVAGSLIPGSQVSEATKPLPMWGG